MKKKSDMNKINNKAIDTLELMIAMDELEKENGISKDELMQSIESALVVAYKKNFECNDENIKVVIDKIDGQMHVYQEKEVVDEVEDADLQISLEDAKKINSNYNIGDLVSFELLPKEFGRIAAQTARQVITQKIREMSREIIFGEFAEKKGELITGLVQKADNRVVILDLGRIEGIMPKKEQMPNETYYINDTVKACIVSVEKGPKGSTQIILSRASTEFVKKLFEIEIPEISEGIIEIKAISRDPGSRSKIAVYSSNPNIDPVGSCVGQKGVRIQNIINELKGEKIDVVEWNEDPSIFISAALLPAQVLAVDIKDEEKFAQVIVPDDQLSLAIGKSGQNAKLAAKLTNWKIDIKSESQFREIIQKLQEEEAQEVLNNIEENNDDVIVTDNVDKYVLEDGDIEISGDLNNDINEKSNELKDEKIDDDNE